VGGSPAGPVGHALMRLLVTGAGGQLGRDLVSAFAAAGDDVVACDHGTLDVADRDRVLQVVGAAAPDTIVHAGAWTNVDGCETDPDHAYAANAMGTRHVAEAARLVGARVCYISTDYVFDGSAQRPYREWDATNPVSVYGRSKLAGEAVLGPADTIVRTSWVCGRHGRNFVKTILARAAQNQPLTVVDDQHGCPTFTEDLAALVRTLVVARLPGLFHATNQGPTTWFQFAGDAVEAAGMDRSLVSPISTAEMQPPRPAPRPTYSVLDNAALRLSGIPLLADHHEPLERLAKELVASGSFA
jgi:dTDP-4-dehydrorhamnose reductase